MVLGGGRGWKRGVLWHGRVDVVVRKRGVWGGGERGRMQGNRVYVGTV